MKMYIIFEEYYENFGICGVTDNKELAENFCNEMNKGLDYVLYNFVSFELNYFEECGRTEDYIEVKKTISEQEKIDFEHLILVNEDEKNEI